MKNTSAKIFIASSIIFGILGITLVMLGGPEEGGFREWMFRVLVADGFLVLASFGVTVGLYFLVTDKK